MGIDTRHDDQGCSSGAAARTAKEAKEECRQEQWRSWLGEKGGSTTFGVYNARRRPS